MEIIIDRAPVVWARPRFSKGRAFTAKPQAEAKEAIRWLFKKAWRGEPLGKEIGIRLSLTFFFKAPRKKDCGTFKRTRPDGDNLAKLILDCGNGLLWEDDAQVVDLRIIKLWAVKPGTKIEIEEVHGIGQ